MRKNKDLQQKNRMQKRSVVLYAGLSFVMGIMLWLIVGYLISF